MNEAMINHFRNRTENHINLVRKYLQKIIDLGLPQIDSELLQKEFEHDASKFAEPEYEPYLHIAWKYKMERDGEKYLPPERTQDKMHEATYHHVKNNKHHPEYWDENVTIDYINPDNRDGPSGNKVDATKMPLTYVASMMADWLAMSEEKGTNPVDWARMNVGVRWDFNKEQVFLIYNIIRRAYEGNGEVK